MLYLTYNDAPSGIYYGQVIDVCKFVREELHIRVRLLAFISLRGYWKNRKKIKTLLPDAIVLPMIPKTRNWRLNSWLLHSFIRRLGEKKCIARGPFATALALGAHYKGILDTVIFDGRGAYVAELNEYNVVPDAKVKAEIKELERNAVLKSQKQLAVSDALVEYWRKEFGFEGMSYRTIPCTLNDATRFAVITDDSVVQARREFGYKSTDCIIIYSGSVAGWQSLEDFGRQILPLMKQQPELHLLLLVQKLPDDFLPAKYFPERIKQRWFNPEQVGRALLIGDYGWLVRENTVTNQVASPVKFAEYLAAGLQVIISEHIGDYSDFVKEQTCGIIFKKNEVISLQCNPTAQKIRLQGLAQQFFLKKAYLDKYTYLFQ